MGVLKDAVPVLVAAVRGGRRRGGGGGGVTVSALVNVAITAQDAITAQGGIRRHTYDRGPGEHALVREQIDHADLEVVILGRRVLLASSMLHERR